MQLSELPPELILEIYRWLYDGTSNQQLLDDISQRHSWTLYVLSSCMICRSWYTVGSEYLTMRLYPVPSLLLRSLLDIVECPISPTLSTGQPSWPQVLLESKKNKLPFHRQVRQMVLNLSSVLKPPLPPRYTPRKNTTLSWESSWEIERIATSIKTLAGACPNLKSIEIVYDSGYTPRISSQRPTRALGGLSNAISDALTLHATDHHHHHQQQQSTSCSFLSHLIFTSREPIQRCPCCAGRGWDHSLRPLLQHLPVTTLELDHVLPSRSVLECLAQSKRIHTLVIRGGILIQASRLARSVTTPPRLPFDLLSQLRTLEIYFHSNKDDDDLDLLTMFRLTYDIIHPIKSLQQLILHGREKYTISLADAQLNNDVWNKLELLAERQPLKSFVLENIPGFGCPTIQSKLQNLFTGVEKVNVVYST